MLVHHPLINEVPRLQRRVIWRERGCTSTSRCHRLPFVSVAFAPSWVTHQWTGSFPRWRAETESHPAPTRLDFQPAPFCRFSAASAWLRDTYQNTHTQQGIAEWSILTLVWVRVKYYFCATHFSLICMFWWHHSYGKMKQMMYESSDDLHIIFSYHNASVQMLNVTSNFLFTSNLLHVVSLVNFIYFFLSLKLLALATVLTFLFILQQLTLRACTRFPMCLDCWFMHKWQIKNLN